MNIIYCRYSPRPEAAVERTVSLQVQSESCIKYCKANGLAVDGIIEDPEVSARKTPLFERPGGRKLLTLPENSNVIAMKLDRVFRDTIDGLTTLKHLRDSKINFHLANEGGCSINTSTATGKMVATFLLGVASWEPEMIAERTSQGLNHRLSHGKAHLNPANFPYGMKEDPNSKVHSSSGHHEGMIEDEDEQDIIKTIITLRKSEYGLSLICRCLAEDGIKCRGKKWFPNTIKRILDRYEDASV
tara:strand:+ start:458 stop:1189 length:732 start_codon:yes stop_codon:yes gene_type:complete